MNASTITSAPVEIENFLSYLRPKSYFLRELRSGWNRSRSSREATRIIKSGEIPVEVINAIYSNENIEILREIDKAEKSVFVTALIELKDAIRRFNERNAIKTGKNRFSDILSEVYSACEDKFETSWNKERLRLKSLFSSFLFYSEACDFDLSKDFRRSFEHFYFSRIGKAKSLSFAKEAERNDFYSQLSFFHNAFDKGIDVVVETAKANYLELLTANLLNALAKHLPETTNRISNIRVGNSAKGYAIEFFLYDGENYIGRIETRSIPVDGYYVRFHYRYITHVFRSSTPPSIA